MAIRTPICDILGIDHPIILGGMMGISDANLTAAGLASGLFWQDNYGSPKPASRQRSTNDIASCGT